MRFTPFTFVGGEQLLVQYLVVGGGSKGLVTATDATGGSGGGIVSGSTYMYFGQTFNVVVGKGGTTGDENGSPSSISTLNIVAGGGGTTGSGFPQTFVTGASVPCGIFGERASGGGAGSAENGAAAGCQTPSQRPGSGGSGSLWTINSVTYGGGGGAGYTNTDSTPTGAGGVGGTGGGGRGWGGTTGAATNGTNGLGGGGGGGRVKGSRPAAEPSGDGGSGSVILAYISDRQLATGGDVTISGSYVYHTFTQNGTFSI